MNHIAIVIIFCGGGKSQKGRLPSFLQRGSSVVAHPDGLHRSEVTPGWNAAKRLKNLTVASMPYYLWRLKAMLFTESDYIIYTSAAHPVSSSGV